jgi:hypothetical protein
MRPSKHVAISVVAATAVYAYFHSTAGALATFFTGVFLDIDHFFDYFYTEGFNFNPKKFLLSTYCLDTPKVFLFFHSYELIVPVILYGYFSGNTLPAWALGTGLVTHILADQFWNPVTPRAYFLACRLYHNFSADIFFRHDYKTVIYGLDKSKVRETGAAG